MTSCAAGPQASGPAHVIVEPPPHQPGAAAYWRLAIDGEPLPDPSPTGQDETDLLSVRAFIDAYTLQPSFSSADVTVPMPATDFEIRFRRTMRIEDGADEAMGFLPGVLGPCWRTTLDIGLVMRRDHTGGTRVVLRDESGNLLEYAGDGSELFPVGRHSFANLAYRGRLFREGNTFVYQLTYGMRKVFAPWPDRDGSVRRYRPVRLVARSGAELHFGYDDGAPYAACLYDPTLIDETKTGWERYRRRITFAYVNLGPEGAQTRLVAVTDPLGRSYEYQFSDEAEPRFVALVKPAVTIEIDSPERVRPVVRFSYEALPEQPLRVAADAGGERILAVIPGEVRWRLPRSITDALGHVTELTYDIRWQPVAVQGVGDRKPRWCWVQRPVVASVRTANGEAVFEQDARSADTIMTRATDAAGALRTWRFTQRLTAGATVEVVEVRREIPVTDADGNTEAAIVTYRFGDGPVGNLHEVEDVSGNIVRFEFSSHEAGDPYGEPVQPGESLSRYVRFGRPSSSVLAAGVLDLRTRYHYDPKWNLLTERVDPIGMAVRQEWDERGNLHRRVRAPGSEVEAVTTFERDEQGFVVRLREKYGRVSDFTKNEFGFQATAVTTDPPAVAAEGEEPPPPVQRRTERYADIMNRTLRWTDSGGSVYVYEYDAWDRTVSWTEHVDEGGKSGTKTYIQKSFYDPNSNLLLERSSRGRQVTATYGPLGRKLTQETRQRNDRGQVELTWESWTYTPTGLVATYTVGEQTQEHHYDQMRRKVRTIYWRDSSPDGVERLRQVRYYYGPNAGSGAFTFDGFNVTRSIDIVGKARDQRFDAAYRQVGEVSRLDDGSGVPHDAPARPGEIDIVRRLNGAHRVTYARIYAPLEDDDQFTGLRDYYYFYDDRGRYTLLVLDCDGDGPGIDEDTRVNDPADVTPDYDDFFYPQEVTEDEE